MKTVIYHNNRCGKSRCALQVLEETGQPFEVVEYLKTPLTAVEIRKLLKKMGKKPLEIIRTKEAVFKEDFQGKDLTDEAWIAAMVEHPILMERPIIVRGEEAWIARDEAALERLRNG
ncbi:MAG: arsenate reductase (glutaredoxin) [Lewinellaceae bacterium]|nr:arsenate reductase (glutaredoxin) [Lewinellaceae bacterium]